MEASTKAYSEPQSVFFGSITLARNCHARLCPRKTPTVCTQRIGLCPAGEICSWTRSKQWKSRGGCWQSRPQMEPRPKSQVCDVGFVFPCGAVGVLWPQPDLLRHSGRKWRKERAKYGSSCQFQAPKVAVEIDRSASSAGSDRARVPRSASRVPGCRIGNAARRTRRTPLDGLRFQQAGLRHPTFLLLASGRPPQRCKVGGVGSVAADAPRAQRWPSGVEITEPLQPAGGLRLRVGKAQGSQAARSGRSVEKEDPARVQQDWHYRRGLAYISAHSGNDASGDGRTPTHDPRLLAAQQPPRHEQVPAADIEDQASGTRQVGRRLLACRLATQTEPGPIGDTKQRIRILEFASCAYRPLISPDPFGSGLVSD